MKRPSSGLHKQADLFAGDVYPNAPGYQKKRQTSKAAAIVMLKSAKTLRDEVLAAVTLAGPKGLTVHEGARLLKRAVSSVQPRFSELANMDPPKIVDSGERRKNVGGRVGVVAWKVAP